MDTPPATTLRDGLGINFNISTAGPMVSDTLGLLARSGIRLARIEIGWDSMSYADPSQLAPGRRLTRLRQELVTMKRLGIRPLILLNSNSGGPTPSRSLKVRLVVPAPRGARKIVVDPATATQIVPGRSGLDEPGLLAGTVFTRVEPDGVVLLSKPLGRDLPAGTQPGSTLRFAPFSTPRLSDGSPNPAFEATMDGWLAYAGGVVRWARRTLGDTDFDLEVWNELSFGSAFLTPSDYYDPPPAGAPSDITHALLDETVRYLRRPSFGLQGVGITDGFASETPFASPATSPSGLSALSKHPYHGLTIYPNDQLINSLRSLNAQGSPDYTGGATFSDTAHDRFIPRYRALFPEYYLTALQTESMERDLSPMTSYIYGVPHGRHVTTQDGKSVGVWMTEMNTDLTGADLSRPGGAGRQRHLDSTDVEHILAKTTLRTYCAFINKGVGRVYIYAAIGAPLGLISRQFVDAVRGGRPPPVSGGPILDALARFAKMLSRAQAITRPRPLRLDQVADRYQRIQFAGDGTAPHPSLHDRDVLAFLPFQLNDHSWIIPTYVMTRDVAHAYRTGSSPSRFDLPDEPFRLQIGGVDASRAKVSLYDPVANRRFPARIIARRGHTVTIQMLATDSPRMLTLSDR
jgi:hypothetical protein